MARLSEVIKVDPLEDSTGRLDQTSNPTISQLAKRKRRLAATRGFDNSGLRIPRSQKFVTPQNSPSKFTPQAGSTPLLQEGQVSTRLAVPIPGISRIRGVQLPNHPPTSPADFIRVSVISPRITPDPSLEWDYDEARAFNLQVNNNLQTTECFREVEELTGLEDIQRLTLVDASSSDTATVCNMSRLRGTNPSDLDNESRTMLNKEVQQEGKKLNKMHRSVLDMMTSLLTM